jgi:signal transduction histidine kinase
MARIILKSATRLGHMVENFLTYAQLEMLAAASASRKFAGKEATVMLDLHVEEISGKKAKEFDRVNDLSLSLGGAEAAISTQSAKRIIEELVDNAFKFSRAGQKVEVETRGEDEHWFLAVRDHGVGMQHQEIAQIGAYRQFGRKSREQQGSGLGLSIAKKMTELYGGVFSIQSEVGNGTTVSVRIPRPLAV